MPVTHLQTGDGVQSRLEKPSLVSLFSYGFRPFFLGASVYGAALMTAWLIWIVTANSGGTGSWLPVSGTPYAWHAHEMVFGFTAAAIAGFLLTAVPNWTGALPLSGPPLVLLFTAWLAGRFAMAMSGQLPVWLAPAIDLLFLPMLGAVAAKQLFLKPAARNLIFLVILTGLTLVNLAFHLGTLGLVSVEPQSAMRAGLHVVAVMITIIGGRVVPAFTHNWMHLENIPGPMPRRIDWLDGAAVVSVAASAMLVLTAALEPLQGAVALAAFVLNAARLALWRGIAARGAPIVWVLHLGYLWVVVGLALHGLATLTTLVPASLASHAIGTGAIGTMTLAIMSRASLGHTGRPLVAPRPIVWAYGLVTLAALLRVAGPLLVPSSTAFVLTLAAVAWIAAFATFAAVYAPILTTPRVHTKVARAS